MTNKEKNIDNLFTSGLERDNPLFKEEHWNQLEGLLDKMPSSGPKGDGGASIPGKSSIVSKTATVSGLTRNLIFTAVSGIIITAASLFFIHNSNNHNNTGESVTPVTDFALITTEEQPGHQTLSASVHIDRDTTSTGYPVHSPLVGGKSGKGDLQARSWREEVITPQNQPESVIIAGDPHPETDDLVASDMMIFNHSTAEKTRDLFPDEALSADDQEGTGGAITQNEVSGFANETTPDDDLPVINKTMQPHKGNRDAVVSLFIEPGVSFHQQLGNTNLPKDVTKAAPTFGLSVQYAMNDRLKLSLGGALLSTKGHQLLYTSTQTFLLNHQQRETTAVENRELLFAEVPLSIHLSMRNHHLGIGPRVLFLLNVHGNKSVAVTTPFSSTSESAATSGYFEGLSRITAGAGIEYSYSFSPFVAIALRYNYMTGRLVSEDVYPNVNRQNLNTLNLCLKISINNLI